MAGDLFGNLGGSLGGLVKGLSNLMPQDDPNVKVLNANSALSDLRKKENELYCEIGRKAFEAGGEAAYPEEGARLTILNADITAAEEALSVAKAEMEAAKAAAEAEEANPCPGCGAQNGPGVKFCQECGSPLSSGGKTFCTNCGTENPPGTKFCGSCGTKLA